VTAALASEPTWQQATTGLAASVRYCTSCLAIYRADFQRCPLDGGALVLGETDPLIGTAVGAYVIDGKLGEGGMGRVYRAHRADDPTHRVALKILLGDLAASSIMRERFQREAEAARQLSHKHIVGVIDYGHTKAGLPFLAMDLVEGTNLAVVLSKGPMAGDRVIRLARQLCEGLDHAHSRGVIHRDFKPDNILIVNEGPDEQVKIADFGLALSSNIETRLTMTGVACTPAYAAPEQLRGGAIDSRVDLYALGTTMYEMLTGGMLPFESDLQGTIRLKLANDAPSLMMIVPDVQPALATLVGRLLAHDPDRRPRSAKSLMIALDAALTAPKRKLRTADMRPQAKDAEKIDVSFPPPQRARANTTARVRKVRKPRPNVRMLAALGVAAIMVGIALGSIVRDREAAAAAAEPATVDQPKVTMQVLATQAAATPVVTLTSAKAAATVPAKLVVKKGSKPRRVHKARRKKVVVREAANPDAVEITQRYGEIGRELQRLAHDQGVEDTDDIFSSYREIQLEAAVATPDSRDELASQLDDIEAAINERKATD
jgi:serine/threonine protein kinase